MSAEKRGIAKAQADDWEWVLGSGIPDRRNTETDGYWKEQKSSSGIKRSSQRGSSESSWETEDPDAPVIKIRQEPKRDGCGREDPQIHAHAPLRKAERVQQVIRA
jgi:hypothetical protein